MAKNTLLEWTRLGMGSIASEKIPLLVGFAGWISLDPYFLWPTKVGHLVIAALASAITLGLVARQKQWRRKNGMEILGAVLLTIFIVYVTLEHRVDGGHSKWIVVLPTLWVLAVLKDEVRIKALNAFLTLFAIGLIPSILVWIWTVLGFPITFISMDPANPGMLPPGGGGLLYLPMVILNETNSVVFPSGMAIFRMCGIYDEPGTIGTIAALGLGALRFRLRDWRCAIMYLAGVMSFSLAFIILGVLGLVVRSIRNRDWRPLVFLVPLAVALSLVLGWIASATRYGLESNVTIINYVKESPPANFSNKSNINEKEIVRPVERRVIAEHTLRQQGLINNRALPSMKMLVADYWKADLYTRIFGFASDASIVKGGMSQIWSRILTDHGLFGFAILVIGYFLMVFPMWQRSKYSFWSAFFIIIISMSVYQRPVVWLPYAMILIICGVLTAAENEPPRGARNLVG